jgi:hypothetical protein
MARNHSSSWSECPGGRMTFNVVVGEALANTTLVVALAGDHELVD